MADQGFVKFHRKIEKWEWYQVIPVKTLFFHLVLVANHKANNWRGVIVARGQLISSLGNLAKKTGLSVQEVRTALKKLESTNEVTVESTNKFTLITVTNYSTYHDKESDSNTDDNNQPTNDQQTTNNQSTTNKNVKKVKNVKNVKKKKGDELTELIFPDCVERELLEKYIENRIIIKKPMTHYAKELFLEKVAKFHAKGQNVKDLVEKAIIGGWSDIYEAKGGTNGHGARKIKSAPVRKAETKSGRKADTPTTYTFKD